MFNDDFEVRSYAYQCANDSGDGMVIAYFNGNQEIPDETILHDGKTYQQVDHLKVDYDSIPACQRDTLAKMAIELTQQVMSNPELRAKCDKRVEEKKRNTKRK